MQKHLGQTSGLPHLGSGEILIRNIWFSTSGTTPVTIHKKNIDVHLKHLTNALNHTLQKNCFPNKLKQSEIIPVYKKNRPVTEGELKICKPVSPHLKGL